ncbi:MAG TPA: vitamin K epoxide reductase family protein [Longimicrobiaceae bacterium]|nr:vitamin K epoxide reductase family protein [Longimicrobiaceae bacterium]
MSEDERGDERGGGGAHGGMGMRGVTRPMAEHESHQEHGGEGGQEGGMDREAMLRRHHRQTLWIPWTLVLLGFWLLAAPFTFGYLDPAQWVEPSGGRGVWFGDALHTELRAALTLWSDVVAGALLVVFGWRALRPGRPVAWWICCFVGIWLTLAPIVLWAPTAVAYLNDTLVGALVIALSVLVPGMPNMIRYMRMGGDTPPGWSYNPSSWPQRWIMIATGFAGWLASRYLAAYQLGYAAEAWDPFFGEGTRRVLDSSMSHAWPVSDAALGTFAYTFEFLMGWMGAPSRWRTMPWMVTFFGILVIPLGLVHVALVVSQPVVVGAWCTFCLLAAAIMVPMIPLEVDEVIAMGQNLAHARRRGESVWRAFWKGGPAEEAGEDRRTPELAALPERPAEVVGASLWGMSFPWTLLASTALGVWLMFAPAVFGLDARAADLHHVGGALVVVVSVVAMGEPLRALRLLDLFLGLGIAAAPWLVEGLDGAARAATLGAGLLVAVLSVPRGPKWERYGGWDRFVF